MGFSKIFKFLIMGIMVFVLSYCGDSPSEPDVSPPPKVENFGASAPTGDLLITLSWDKSPASDFNYFILYRKRNSGNYEVVDTLIETKYTDSVDSYTDMFSYKIVAVDNAGNVSEPNEDAYNIQSANITPPTIPDSLTVIAMNRGLYKKIQLTWQSSSYDVGSFLLFRQYSDSLKSVVDTITLDGKLRSYVDTVTYENVVYSYSIMSKDLGGKISKVSDSVSDIVLSAPILTYPIKSQVIKTSKVQFLFSSVENAQRYELIVSQAKDLVDTVFVPSKSGVSESIEIDLSKIASLEKGMDISWKILTYSKSTTIYNSMSSTETFIYNP